VKRFLLVCLVGFAVVGTPVGAAAAASPKFRISIAHYVHGCHVWLTGENRGPATTIRVKRGTRVEIRLSCPMDFEFRQLAGPRLALGTPRTVAGTTRTIAFRKPGRYVLTATNVQSSEEAGLETLGADNMLKLTVVVR
jgi:hypothetical protein